MRALSAEIFRLLGELRENNNRDWYQSNKALIESTVLGPTREVAGELREWLSDRMGVAMGIKFFKMHRDLRFSKDKTPYNPYVRFSIGEEAGGPEGGPGFYFSVEPEMLIMGTGIFELGTRLASFRERSGELGAVLPPDVRISEPELKRLPAGLNVEASREADYRRKSLTVWLDQPNASGVGGRFGLAELERLVPVWLWIRSLTES